MTNKSTFIFQDWELQEDNKTILFHYRIKKEQEEIKFTETLILPTTFSPKEIPSQILQSLVNSIHLMLGISYWKLYCPKQIEIASYTLSQDQAVFWDKVYTKGLGEFFYENKIDFRELIHFPFDNTKQLEKSASFPRKNRSLLPIGGGKDSIVAAQLLKKAQKPFSIITFYTGLQTTIAQKNVSAKIQKETFIVKRMLDPKLLELNKRKDTYNGHVPAVAIYSFISLLLAAIYDFRFVVFANEQSASYGNIAFHGEMVNHQWSKSLEFETMLQEYLEKYITKDIDYFSLLRPFSEIKIAQLFSSYPEYFSSFVSCNRGFRMENKGKTNWCCQCPKCAFVFLLLSAFLSKQQLLDIFGKNLFEDKSLLPLYKELLGLSAFKPFECVGTPEEVRLSLYFAWEKGAWKETAVMKVFSNEVLPHLQNHKEQKEHLFSLFPHKMPKEFLSLLTI